MTNTDTPCRPIIFVGPSIPLDLAKRTLPHADYRPPIKRGDLDDVPPGAIVGIIDGVFAQTLAISPGEIREAIGRGVAIYGAASMGALRAAEVPKVVGVGRVFEMYRSGTIERDDEVALLFHPDTYEPLTEPLVNVRYAVERLVRSATLSRNAGDALIKACSQLHFTERTYETIFKTSKLAHNADVEDIICLLRTFDLKQNDAQFLLETMSQLEQPTVTPSVSAREAANGVVPLKNRAHDREDSDAPVMVWESGDCVDFSKLLRFLKVVGTFEKFARNALGRWAIAGAPLRSTSHGSDYTDSVGATNGAQLLLDSTRLQWGWDSPEEAHVTMRDLGLGLLDVSRSLEAELITKRRIAAFGKNSTEALKKALRSELWMDDLSLKRETLRFGALHYFAKRGAEAGPATESELSGAKRCICRLRMAMRWSAVQSGLDELGVLQPEVDAMVWDLALARRAGWPVVQAMDHRCVPKATEARADHWLALGLGFESSVKPEGSNRFSLSLPAAARCAEEIAKQIGIVRIGLIGELDTLGVHVAQAFAERSGWSASFSSGKAETRDGARVGSIMEEVEIRAQDAFQAPREIRTPFAEYCDKLPLVNPRTLDLPYDSPYSDTAEIDWSVGIDLLNCRKVLVPTACLLGERVTNDIYYSPRLGGKTFSTSGLGSGFSLAEATVHAAAEYIERHAQRLAEFEIDNPGGVGIRQFWFVDHGSLPDTPRRIVEKYRRAGMCVRILDITSEVAVPTFYVRVFDDPFTTYPSATSDGFGCHPNPEVAVTMALLEAAQTRAGIIAGGREDYSLQARSLGRHERPRTMLPQSQAFWFGNDRPFRSFRETSGFVSQDILEELEWIIGRVEEAGVSQFIVVDYTMDRIRPAFAVRVIIPGLETTNPLFTGERARATSIRDMLPRLAAEAE
jgi:ribosomal protein S12 methylthiotransferase accessory factor